MTADRKAGEAALGCALAGVGATLAYLASRMPAGSVALPGPGFMPLAIGVLLALAGSGCAVSAWCQRGTGGAVGLGGARTWGALATLSLVGLAFEPVGAPVTLAVATAVWARLLGDYGFLRCGLLGIAASAVAWSVFTRVLGVGLPAGILPL
ncbi:MAG TPA: tripartite tricarboxylate transporter TctB family protein [Azospirillaceae bacterium]|nr:tripartite tricarboxylate transporter TctB family protein [Azospirillaceae bacterium]